MKNVIELTIEDINAMNYNELIGLTHETNRTPGGLETIKYVARELHFDRNSKILDIGTSTGHTTIEFSRLLDCEMVGIDINQTSIDVATERCQNLNLNKAKFILADATQMPFDDGFFDAVFAGNVTSLISDRQKALDEYWRVVKKNGYLIVVPMYYIDIPSTELLNNVCDAIKVNIKAYYKSDWVNFFLDDKTEVFSELDFKFTKSTDSEINAFCDAILNRPHLSELENTVLEKLKEKYIKYMHLFNENLSHMGFTVLILRRKESEIYNDPQLYFSEVI